MNSNKGVGKQTARLSPAETTIINESINQFEDDNPRRKKIILDMDFLVPLIVKLRSL